MLDLHIHSKYSFDGEMSLDEIISVSKALGVKIISLTDHDNIRGLKDFIKLANQNDLVAIPGVELSTLLREEIESIPYNANIHILGYNFDYKNTEFQNELERIEKKDKMKEVELLYDEEIESLRDVVFFINGKEKK